MKKTPVFKNGFKLGAGLAAGALFVQFVSDVVDQVIELRQKNK